MAEIDPLAFQKGYQASQAIVDASRQNKLQDLILGQKLAEISDTQNANRLYSAAVGPDGTIDRNKLVTSYAQNNLGSKIPGLQTQFAAQDKAQREADKARLESVMQNVQLQGQLLGGVTDDASYQNAKAVAQQNGIDVSKLPPNYDPNTIAQLRNRALSAAQQVEQEWKQKKYDQDASQFQQTQAITRRGQDMSAQTAAENRSVTMRGQDLQNQRALDTNNAKIAQGQQERVRDANDALGLLDQAEKLIPQATGSYLGAGRDLALRSIGAATDAGNAAAQLKALEGALVSKMPKMSGPQSDKDVAMYRQMAGQIGDPTIPAETKMAAIKTIREIQNKYAGNAPAAVTNSVGGGDQAGALAELQRRAKSDPALAAKLKAMGY